MTGAILSSAEAGSAAISGGKAAALAALSCKGFDVPPFLVLTDAAFEARAVRADVKKELAARLGELGSGPFAVRSSGRDEDGASHSHAGQFLSMLDIAPAKVAAAAHRVWMSGALASVGDYRISRGLERDGGKPAVVVQQMVRARAAGVCFTANPVNGRRGQIVVSATEGLGDRLVGGEVDGQTWVLEASTGAVIEKPEDAPVLTLADVAALRELALKVERAQGAPQDIEWALEGERLYLLQSRPITTPLKAEPILDGQITIFDNSNIVESYPGLVSPLTYSFAQYAYARVYRMFVAMIGVSQPSIRAHAAVFDNMLGRIEGRVYYNLINWYRALALLPGFASNRAHMETMMGVGEPLPRDIADRLAPLAANGLGRLLDQARVGKMGAMLLWRAALLPATRRGFFARLKSAVATTPDMITAMPLTALAAEYRRIEADLLDRWDAPLVNDFLCMIAFGASRKLMERWGGPESLELHNAVMIGQGDIISAEPAQRIARMGALARGDEAMTVRLEAADRSLVTEMHGLGEQLRAYLARFGDRCTEELKLESITLHEDPTQLLLAVAAATRGGEVQPRSETDVDAALKERFGHSRFKRGLVRLALQYAKARVRDRENLRFERTRIFGHARRVLLAMGTQLHAHGLIDDARDVFLLTVQEVLGAVEGFAVSADLRGLANLRRAEMVAAAGRQDPPERIAVTGPAAAYRAVTAEQAPRDEGRVRTATGCSAGVMRGVARVIADPRRQSLARGEILVSRHTDPGWIAVFSNAAAMVVERGSLLSHSAIVAREMGIPCVVGLKGATNWIADGEIIEVDGRAGIVTRIEAGQPNG
jgi:rifampicin phosphotransferase